MKEQSVVDEIERQLKLNKRYYVNVHGSLFSTNGTADFLTHDKYGRFIGIEAKVDGKSPVINQWRKAMQMLNSGLRYVIAQSDFDLEKIDNNSLPIVEMGNSPGDEFDMEKVKINQSTEVKLITNH